VRLEIRAEKCTGCRIRENFCSFHHEEAIWPARARITIVAQSAHGPFVPTVCRQCEGGGFVMETHRNSWEPGEFLCGKRSSPPKKPVPYCRYRAEAHLLAAQAHYLQVIVTDLGQEYDPIIAQVFPRAQHHQCIFHCISQPRLSQPRDDLGEYET